MGPRPQLTDDPAAYEAALAAIEQLPGFAGQWFDDGGAPGYGGGASGGEYVVLVVRTTGDEAAMEAGVREWWPGSVCVVGEATYTESEARALEDELRGLPGSQGGVGGSPRRRR